jgi:hypothetical protein
LAAEPEATRSRWPKPSGVLGLAGTIVALVSGIVGLVFLLKPDLRPSGKAPKQAATLSQLRVEPAPRREYLARIGTPTRPYTERDLARRGELLRFRVAVTGFEGKPLILRSELFARASGKQLAESKAIRITPTNDTVEASQYLWLPLPNRPGKFYAVVELGQERQNYFQSLDTLETPSFSGLGSRRS